MFALLQRRLPNSYDTLFDMIAAGARGGLTDEQVHEACAG
jgi:hypothetical protein